jgi:hypothetical protein
VQWVADAAPNSGEILMNFLWFGNFLVLPRQFGQRSDDG